MSNKSFNDKVNEFRRNIVWAIIIIFIALILIWKFITEILIPVIIGLFLIGLALALSIIFVRLFAKLFAYLTLKMRCRRKIADLSKEISQLEDHVSVRNKRGLTAGADLRQLDIVGKDMYAQRQSTATALADYLQNKLDGLYKSRDKIERKIGRSASDKLSRKLEKINEKAAPLETEIEQLKSDYDIEPDPAFKRKERMYPMISGFDRFVSSRFKGYWNQ